uniref:EGF-like domain-containing protein n=1 Tax=Panagrolaimus superbus TaxID=310955 RepID=A0A914YPI4_9BILA
MDGKKDCFDGSDEDKDYVRLLTSCLYPPKSPSNIPNNGFIPQQPTGLNLPTNANNFIPSPTSPSLLLPNNQYPGGGGSYARITRPPTFPWKPPQETTDKYSPFSISNELVPINPFVRGPLTLKPPNNGETINPTISTSIETETNNYGQGEIDNYGLPDFGQNGVQSGGGIYGAPITPIIPVNKFTKPPYPFEEGSKVTGPNTKGRHTTKRPGDQPGESEETNEKEPTEKPPWINIATFPPPKHTHPTVSPHSTKQTINPEDEWIIQPIEGIPSIPNESTKPHPTEHPTQRPSPIHPSTKYRTKATPLPHRTRTRPSSTSPATSVSEFIPTKFETVVSDPYYFAQGIDSQLTTSSSPQSLNCTEKIKKAANELVPHPICECPAGQMKTKDGQCVKAEISTFRARLLHLCNVGVRDNYVENEAQILTWKLAATFDYPVCVRKADDIIIFNTVCNGCEFSDLIDRYASNNDLSEIDVKLSELQKSGCYEFVINDCDEKAECIPDGLRYRCKCLPGTTDSDGTGRFCSGVVIANECVKIFGLCVLFWIILLLLLALLLPIIGYLLWKYCKKRNYKVFDRFSKKKNQTDIALTPRTGNIEAGGEITGVTTESSGAQWEGYNRGNIPTITTTNATTPRSTPLNQHIPADEYSIIENEDDDEKDSSKGDNESLAASTDSTTALHKPALEARVITSPDRRSSTGSRSATPTIWETYKILGQQYTTSGSERRKSSTHSLEMLIRKRQEEELKKRATAMSLPDVDIGVSSKPPIGKERGSIESARSAEAEQAAKLAEMLGVDTSTVAKVEEVKDVSILNVAGEPPTAEVATIEEKLHEQRQFSAIVPEINLGSVPSTPEIIKAAENAVNDALKNVMGSHYEPPDTTVNTSQSAQTAIDERLQTTTKASPTGSREDLPIIGNEAPQRPPSGNSIRSRSALPNPTIESTDITEELDKVAEALSQLPALPVSSLSKNEENKRKIKTSKTQPSTARGSKTSFDLVPKSARSLNAEKLPKIMGSPTRNSQKTISSTMKEKPTIKRTRSSKSVISDDIPSTAGTIVIKPKSALSSPATPKKNMVTKPKFRPIASSSLSGTQLPPIAPKRKLPPVPRQPSSTSLKPKKFLSNPSTRQLSNISENSDGTPSKSSITLSKQIPHSVSLPNTARSGKSKLPRLVDAKKVNENNHNYDEPNYILADLDLDLPGPFMVPGSLEDLRNVGFGTSKLPHLDKNVSTQSAPSTDRRGKSSEILNRQQSTKSDEFWKYNTLPPIDVDLEDLSVPDFDIDTSRTEKPIRHSTIARKIASRKAAGQNYPLQKPTFQQQQQQHKDKDKDKDKEDIDIVYEYRRPRSNSSHIHDGCLINQPPWDSTPLKEGELDQIPLDWNLSRSSSLLSFTDRKTQSFTDLHKITTMQVTTTSTKTNTNLSRTKSESGTSLTNVFHFKAKIKNNNNNNGNGNDVDWIDDIKKSLGQTNSWLDYD